MRKIRTDFVTNSSSSSFIIAYREHENIDDETLAKYPFLKHYNKMVNAILFSHGGNETTEGEIIKTKEEWDEYILDNYKWGKIETLEELFEEEDWLKEIYDKAVQYLEKGFNILTKSVDYEDAFFGNFLDAVKDEDELAVIYGED